MSLLLLLLVGSVEAGQIERDAAMIRGKLKPLRQSSRTENRAGAESPTVVNAPSAEPEPTGTPLGASARMETAIKLFGG